MLILDKLTANQLKIFKNIKWLFSAYVYRFIIGFFTLAVVTRYLGPSEYGIYAYSLSAFAFVELFLQLINQEVLKKKFIECEDKKVLINTVVVFHFLISLILIALTLLILWGGEVETGKRRVLMSIFSLSLFFRSGDIISFYLSSQMLNDKISKVEMSVVTIFNIFRVILVKLKASVIHFAWAVILSRVLEFFSMFFIYKKLFKKTSSKIDLALLKPILKNSLPLFISASATVIFTRIDQVMLGNLLTDSAVGIYSVVVKLSEPWIFIAAVITQSLFPDLVSMFGVDKEKFEKKVQKVLTVLLALSLFIIIGTQFFGNFVVSSIFSDNYLAAVPILKLHILYLPFIFWMHISNQYDVLIGATHITLFKTVVASIINIVLNYVLIQEIGVIGASYATIASYVFASFLVNLVFKKTRPLFILQLKSVLFWKEKWLFKS